MKTVMRLNAPKIANMLGMKLNAVYKAMQDGRLEHQLDGKFKWCTQNQVDEFSKKRAFKKRSYFATWNGMKLSCPSKGTYNVEQAAKYMGCKKARIYHLLANNKLTSIRKGTYHIFTKKELDRYLYYTYENCEFLKKII